MLSGIPVDLRGFLKYPGCNVDAYTISDRKKKNDFLEKISEKIKVTSETVGEATGTDRILRSTAMKDSSSFEKKSGYRQRLQ